MSGTLERLEALARLQGLRLGEDTSAVLERLEGPLRRHAEIELRSDGGRIDLVTLSRDPDDVAAFLSLLSERGVSPEESAPLHTLARFGGGHTIGMKLPIAGPSGCGEVYVRGALPIAEAGQFLGRQGLCRAACEALGERAVLLGKDHVHMLAADSGSPRRFSVFLTTYLRKDDREDEKRLDRLLRLAAVSDDGAAEALELHHLLGARRPETLFVSWGMVDGDLAPGLKLDYVDVRLGLVAEAIASVGTPEQADLPARWGGIVQARTADYAGVRIGPDGPTAVRAYFARALPPG